MNYSLVRTSTGMQLETFDSLVEATSAHRLEFEADPDIRVAASGFIQLPGAIANPNAHRARKGWQYAEELPPGLLLRVGYGAGLCTNLWPRGGMPVSASPSDLGTEARLVRLLLTSCAPAPLSLDLLLWKAVEAGLDPEELLRLAVEAEMLKLTDLAKLI